MLILVITICAIMATFFVVRYFAARTRLADDNLNKIIAEKLARSEYTRKLTRLQEDNSILRNLIIDIVENDTDPRILQTVSPEEKSRLRADRLKRQRELLAEAVFVLKHSEPAKRPTRDLKIES